MQPRVAAARQRECDARARHLQSSATAGRHRGVVPRDAARRERAVRFHLQASERPAVRRLAGGHAERGRHRVVRGPRVDDRVAVHVAAVRGVVEHLERRVEHDDDARRHPLERDQRVQLRLRQRRGEQADEQGGGASGASPPDGVVGACRCGLHVMPLSVPGLLNHQAAAAADSHLHLAERGTRRLDRGLAGALVPFLLAALCDVARARFPSRRSARSSSR